MISAFAYFLAAIFNVSNFAGWLAARLTVFNFLKSKLLRVNCCRFFETLNTNWWKRYPLISSVSILIITTNVRGVFWTLSNIEYFTKVVNGLWRKLFQFSKMQSKLYLKVCKTLKRFAISQRQMNSWGFKKSCIFRVCRSLKFIRNFKWTLSKRFVIQEFLS